MSRSRFIRGTAQLFFAEALLLPTGFITAIFLARTLEPAGYGTFALITQFVIWIEYLLVAGLEHTAVKFISSAENRKPLINTVYCVYAVLGLLVAAVVILLAPAVAGLVRSPEISPLLVLLALDIPLFTLAHAGRHIAAGRQKFHQNAVMRSSYWISRLLFIILFVSIGLSLKGAVLGLICASFLEAVLGFVYSRPNFLRGGFDRLSRFWHFIAPLQIAEINKRLLVQELIVLKALGTTSFITGLYGAAKNLGLAPILLSKAVKPTLVSLLSLEKSGKDVPETREMALTVLRAVFWSLPLAVIMYGSSRELITFIFGRPYSDAAPLFSILLFVGMGFLTINTGLAIFTAWNRPRLSVSVTWPLVPVAVIGYIVLYPRLGAQGIALATLVAVGVSALLTFFILYRQWRLFPPPATVVRSILCSMVCLAVSWIWKPEGVLVLVKLCLLAVLCGLIMWVTGEFSAGERKFLLSLFSGREKDAGKK